MAASALTNIALCSALAALVLAPATPSAAAAAEPAAAADVNVSIVVVRENSSGSASAAQSYLDAIFSSAAKRNGWTSATGKYFTKRSKAKKYIDETKPSFGFLTLGAYLGLRKAHDLKPIAVADAGATGGAHFFIITKNHITIDQCKGKTLATNHAGDGKFIDKVVSADDFDLADFEVVPTRRPVQTIKAVVNDEAECALIDDSQLMAMAKVEGGAMLRPVWHSPDLPAMLIVSFGSAPAGQVKSFKATVEQLCEDDGRSSCEAAGLDSPKKVARDAYAAYEAAYDG